MLAVFSVTIFAEVNDYFKISQSRYIPETCMGFLEHTSVARIAVV